MKYAIVESGGKQFKAVEGGTIDVDKLDLEVGKKLEIKDVLLVSDGKVISVGTPTVSGAKVTTSVVDQFKAPKVTVFKYKSRQRYRVKTGHRQQYTRLAIEAIEYKGMVKEAEAKDEEKQPEAEKKPETKAAPKAAPKTQAKAAPKAAPKTKTKAAPKTKTKTKAAPKTKTKTKAAPKTKTKTKTKTSTKSTAKTKTTTKKSPKKE
jgi:large subunit ribosomal protein L21